MFKKEEQKRTLNIPDVVFIFVCLKLNETQLLLFVHHIQIVQKSVLTETVTYFHVIKNYFYSTPKKREHKPHIH